MRQPVSCANPLSHLPDLHGELCVLLVGCVGGEVLWLEAGDDLLGLVGLAREGAHQRPESDRRQVGRLVALALLRQHLDSCSGVTYDFL